MRNSPVARTPPKNLPVIPGVTCDSPKDKPKHGSKQVSQPEQPSPVEVEKGTNIKLESFVSHSKLTSLADDKKQEEEQFEMDI